MSETMKRRLNEPEEQKRRSESQRRRRRLEREAVVEMPTHKRCSGCGDFKPVEDYYTKRRRLVDGSMYVYPDAKCKECVKATRRGEYEALTAEERRERRRRELEVQDAEKRRRSRREWSAARRRKEGRPQSTARVVDIEYDGERLPGAPIAGVLREELRTRTVEQIAVATGIDPRRLYAVLHQETPNVSLRVIDQILQGIGRPEALPLLYPVDDGKLVGYHYLDAA